MSSDWGPWIVHDGSGCAVPIGTLVELWFDPWPEYGYPGARKVGIVRGGLSWEITRPRKVVSLGVIVVPLARYRIRRPRGMKVLDQILTKVASRPGITVGNES